MAPTFRNFIYNAERGFIFAYVPKVACTNWKALLRYIAGHENWLDNKLAHDKVNGGLRYLDLDGKDSSILQDRTIRKYAMVRDPYSRVLSAYLNKVEDLRPPRQMAASEDHFSKVVWDIDSFRREHLDQDRYPEITFEVFLLWLRDSGSWFTKDEHWVPQATLLRQPDVHFDILGRFENLTEDAPRILRAMGCDQGFPSQKDVKFAPTKAQEKMQHHYTGPCLDIAKELYRDDLNRFGYSRCFL
jgi:hypothetical protein